MIGRSYKKNLKTKKMRIIYFNTTKKKSSRFIIGVPKYSTNDSFLKFSKNHGKNKKNNRGKLL